MKQINAWIRWLPLGLFIGFVVVAGYYILAEKDPNHLPSQLIDRPLPQFELMDVMTLEQTSTADWIGKKALVNVWATWCPTCYAEHDYLTKLAADGVLIYGVDYNDDLQEAQKFLTKYGNPYQSVVFDQKGRLAVELGVYGAPETFIIDSKGTILYRHVGDVNQRVWDGKLKAIWEQAQ